MRPQPGCSAPLRALSGCPGGESSCPGLRRIERFPFPAFRRTGPDGPGGVAIDYTQPRADRLTFAGSGGGRARGPLRGQLRGSRRLRPERTRQSASREHRPSKRPASWNGRTDRQRDSRAFEKKKSFAGRSLRFPSAHPLMAMNLVTRRDGRRRSARGRSASGAISSSALPSTRRNLWAPGNRANLRGADDGGPGEAWFPASAPELNEAFPSLRSHD